MPGSRMRRWLTRGGACFDSMGGRRVLRIFLRDGQAPRAGAFAAFGGEEGVSNRQGRVFHR